MPTAKAIDNVALGIRRDCLNGIANHIVLLSLLPGCPGGLENLWCAVCERQHMQCDKSANKSSQPVIRALAKV